MGTVLLAQWLRALPAYQSFESRFPGVVNQSVPAGIPAWLAWQHYLNALFLVLIVRTALTLRTKVRPVAFYRRRNEGRFFRTRESPRRIGVHLWLHLSIDALWVLNGIVYVVLLFATGQWVRIVPTSWDVVPNALSSAVQYASLNWPADSAWTHYNALQQLSYFVVVFIAAPLAVLTGLRLSPAWPLNLRVNWLFPETATRRLHRLTLWFFVGFVGVHVCLVLGTGALTNLNAMFAAINSTSSWLGTFIFAGALASFVAVWGIARPAVIARVAARFGEVR